MARLFVAIGLSADVRWSLAALAEPVRGIRWVQPDRFHLTLQFLGAVAPERTAGIVTALQGVQAGVFGLAAAGVGAFGRGEVVLWAGVGGAVARLENLRGAIEAALRPLGFAGDRRPYTPHITVGRGRRAWSRAGVAAWCERHAGQALGDFHVGGFELYESLPGSAGTVYEPRARVAFPPAG